LAGEREGVASASAPGVEDAQAPGGQVPVQVVQAEFGFEFHPRQFVFRDPPRIVSSNAEAGVSICDTDPGIRAGRARRPSSPAGDRRRDPIGGRTAAARIRGSAGCNPPLSLCG
jgi:hypothetical protein